MVTFCLMSLHSLVVMFLFGIFTGCLIYLSILCYLEFLVSYVGFEYSSRKRYILSGFSLSIVRAWWLV